MDLRQANPEDILAKAIGLDDTISFRCKGCGKCCKNRHDLLFTPMDLHRAGRYLGRTVKELVERYCEVYLGDNSHFPMVKVTPVPPKAACPFQRGSKCVLHNAKPTVCAAYPLARITLTEEGKEPQYVLQEDVHCGADEAKPITVREFLGRNHSAEIDRSGMEWGLLMTQHAEKIYPIWQGMPKWRIPYYSLALLNLVYFSLDTAKSEADEMLRVKTELPALVDTILAATEAECAERYEALLREMASHD